MGPLRVHPTNPRDFSDDGGQAMRRTRSLAMPMNLAAIVPHDELASTGYCLANPGQEYLVDLPDGSATVVDLCGGSGPFRVEWMNAAEGTTAVRQPITAGAERGLQAPFRGDAVLWIRRMP